MRKRRGVCRPAAKRAIQTILRALGLETRWLRDPLSFFLQSLGICVWAPIFLGTLRVPGLSQIGAASTSRFCGWVSERLTGNG